MLDLTANTPQVVAQFSCDPRSLLNNVPGLFVVNKCAGISSAKVLERIKRVIGDDRMRIANRIGHGGTLDPAATGVLIILLGKATRLMDSIHAFEKEYLACIQLGVTTDTYDLDGHKSSNFDGELPNDMAIETALAKFRGEILQTPPPYSALKVLGSPMYKLSVYGVEFQPEPRPVTVSSLELVSRCNDALTLKVVASKGFYVRSMAHELGASLGCGAALASLQRTSVGPFSLNDAHDWQTVANKIAETIDRYEN